MSGPFAEVRSGEFVRYVLYVSLASPWAHRSVIVRRLLGLQDAIARRVVDPMRDETGWRFTLGDGGADPVAGASYVLELYQRSDPAFAARATSRSSGTRGPSGSSPTTTRRSRSTCRRSGPRTTSRPR